MSKIYKIPIVWQSYKIYEAKADNLQEGIIKAINQFLSEPDDSYLDDSFQFDEDYMDENYPEEEFNTREIYNSL
jgi:hypothetical protein